MESAPLTLPEPNTSAKFTVRKRTRKPSVLRIPEP
jgi:hypothetical protein